MKPNKNISGKRYGKLIVISCTGEKRYGRYTWNCICDCGNTIIANVDGLSRGVTLSCGCLTLDKQSIHEMARTGEYRSWRAMKARCINKNDPSYKNYGGRGITVCERWANSFENFIKDMGKKPSPKYSIDRIKNDGNYSPENCKWATPTEQARNKRCTTYITYAGVTQSAKDWSERLNVKYANIQGRIRNRWTTEEALEIINHTLPNYKIQTRQLIKNN